MLGLMLATAAMAASAEMPAKAPRVMAVRTQASGYPKLFRCASPIAQPVDQPEYSAACREWRQTELNRLAALSVPARIERVAILRERMGLNSGEGMGVTLDGKLAPVPQVYAAR